MLREHFQAVYDREGANATFEEREDELVVRVRACPTVAHMKANGYPVARLWRETTETVNHALCEGTPFASELVEYDDDSGCRVERFYRRPCAGGGER